MLHQIATSHEDIHAFDLNHTTNRHDSKSSLENVSKLKEFMSDHDDAFKNTHYFNPLYNIVTLQIPSKECREQLLNWKKIGRQNYIEFRDLTVC